MPFDEADIEQAGRGIIADDKLTLFEFGMVRVGKNASKRVGECRDRVDKRDAMFAYVGCCFALIPLELHEQRFSLALVQRVTPVGRSRYAEEARLRLLCRQDDTSSLNRGVSQTSTRLPHDGRPVRYRFRPDDHTPIAAFLTAEPQNPCGERTGHPIFFHCQRRPSVDPDHARSHSEILRKRCSALDAGQLWRSQGKESDTQPSRKERTGKKEPRKNRTERTGHPIFFHCQRRPSVRKCKRTG